MNKTKEKVLSFIYGSQYDKLCDIIADMKRIKDISHFEFEIRIANELGHCSRDFWNIYDKYLEQYTEHNDVIISYQNTNLRLKDRFIREYVFGTIAQEKVMLMSLNSVSANSDVIPIISKLSKERNISTELLREMKPFINSYARTYRKSSTITCPLLSKRSQKYIENWSVDKTVRIISNSRTDYRITNKLVDDVDDPNEYDILDFEFEFVGEKDKLEDSIIALIEFLYVANPLYANRFYNVSVDFQYYSILTDNKIQELFIRPKIKQIANCQKKIYVPEDTESKLLIYNSDHNYIETDIENIDLSHFSNFKLNKFSIIHVFKANNCKYFPADIYSYHNTFIYNKKCSERDKYLHAIVDSSEIFEDNKLEASDDVSTIAIYDNYKDICLIPNHFFVNLHVEMCSDEQTYVLYATGKTILTSPLLRNRVYTPIGNNDFERKILNKEIDINNTNVQFECKLINDYIELIPVKITEKLNMLNEAVFIILETYSQAFHVNMFDSKPINVMKELMFQVILEKENTNIYKNIFIYAPFRDCVQGAIQYASHFINYDTLIFQSEKENIISNLNKYHTSDFIIPVITSTRIVRTESKSIYALNMQQNSYRIPEIYKNNMNLIITTFHKYTRITEFVSVFETIFENICEDGKVIFNYICIENNIFQFIYDINISLKSINDCNANYNNSNVFIETNDFRYIINHRPTDKFTIVKSTASTRSAKFTLIAKDDNHKYYKYGECERSSLTKQLVALILVSLENESMQSNLILFIINELSKHFNFNYNLSYPINIRELMEKIAYDRIISATFKEIYKQYISINIKF